MDTIKQGEKLVENFISSRDGPKKSTETRQKWKNVKIYGMQMKGSLIMFLH